MPVLAGKSFKRGSGCAAATWRFQPAGHAPTPFTAGWKVGDELE